MHRGHRARVVHVCRADDADAGDNRGAASVAGRHDAGALEVLHGVLVTDAHAHLSRNLAEQAQQHHLLLEGLEHRLEIGGEAVPVAREVGRATEHHATLLAFDGRLKERGHERGNCGALVRGELIRDAVDERTQVGTALTEDGIEQPDAQPGHAFLRQRRRQVDVALFDAAGVGDDDEQQAVCAQSHELDMQHARLHQRRVLHECHLAGELRE